MSKITVLAGSTQIPYLSIEVENHNLIIRNSSFPDQPFIFSIREQILRSSGFSAIPLPRVTAEGPVKGVTVRIWPVIDSADDILEVSIVGLPDEGKVTWFVSRREFNNALVERKPNNYPALVTDRQVDEWFE